jgi:hypothetical protein
MQEQTRCDIPNFDASGTSGKNTALQNRTTGHNITVQYISDAALQMLAATPQIATATPAISQINQFCLSNSSQIQPQEPRSCGHSLFLLLLLVHKQKLHSRLPSNQLLRM